MDSLIGEHNRVSPGRRIRATDSCRFLLLLTCHAISLPHLASAHGPHRGLVLLQSLPSLEAASTTACATVWGGLALQLGLPDPLVKLIL